MAEQTALLSLMLEPGGGARFAEVRRRPIAFPAAAVHGASTAPDHFLEVSYPGRQPLRLPLSLGRPGEETEARGAWSGGGTILRAPCFGRGTRYALFTSAERGARQLAALEVHE